jgi:GNAT superfamily N-acetyltransferase
VSLPSELLELAEHSNTYTPLGAGERRVEDPRFVVWLGPSKSAWATVVQRLRLGDDDVESAVDGIRDLLYRLDRPRRCQWEVSGSATPADLHERLLALGFEPDPEPEVVGMVLTQEPPPVPAGVTVRRVETLADYAASQEIAHVAFGVPEKDLVAIRERDASGFEQLLASPDAALFLAELDGTPVASARATFARAGVVLNSGATLPAARGRGAYRALVRARWEEGRRRGTPALVTQAGAQSRPILGSLGFVEVAEIRVLLDGPAAG